MVEEYLELVEFIDEMDKRTFINKERTNQQKKYHNFFLGKQNIKAPKCFSHARSIDQSIDQSINQSIKNPINQLIN